VQVTDADFERAAETSEKGGAESGAPSAQNAAPLGRAANSGESHSRNATPFELVTCAIPGDTQRDSAQVFSREDRIRTPRENTGKTGISDQSGVESGALDAQKDGYSPDLAAVVDAWPKLPEATRAGILAVIRAAE